MIVGFFGPNPRHLDDSLGDIHGRVALLEAKVLHALDSVVADREVFRVVSLVLPLVAEPDVGLSFATVALENSWSRRRVEASGARCQGVSADVMVPGSSFGGSVLLVTHVVVSFDKSLSKADIWWIARCAWLVRYVALGEML